MNMTSAITDSEAYEANVFAVVKLYEDLIRSDKAEACKLADKLFSGYGFARREVARIKRDRAKVSAKKGTK